MSKYDFELDLSTMNTTSIMIQRIQDHSEVLEFGPANGRLTKYLKTKKNCQVDIVEIHEQSGHEAAEFARDSYIGPQEGNIENYYWDNKQRAYDYIIFADVLEHLYNPKDVLEKAAKRLKKEGKILISIPNVAHNSIIIDLINGEFRYTPTGLLDETHIRFFTYKSFKRLIKMLDLVTTFEAPVYSRVGFNEINNSYRSISNKLEVELRKRKEGSVYQYIFEVQSPNEVALEETIHIEDMDVYGECEAVCYVKTSGQVNYDEINAVRKLYRVNEESLTIDISEFKDIEEIRFDPLGESAVYLLRETQVKVGDTWQAIKPSETNAFTHINNIHLFKTDDPQIYYKPILENISQIKFDFKILEYRIHDYLLYEDLISEIQYERQEQLSFFKDILNDKETIINALHEEIKEEKSNLKNVMSNLEQEQLTIQHLTDQLNTINQELENIKSTFMYKLVSLVKRRFKR